MHEEYDHTSLSQQDWAQMMDLPVGEILRRTRMHYGLQLADVEQALRIRASQLDAIEQGHVEYLPGRAYAIGFVRSYAEFLGLDGDKVVYLFKTQTGNGKPRPELNFPAHPSESKLPNKYVLIASFTGLVLVVGLAFMTAKKEVPSEIPPAPEHIQQEKTAAVLYGPPKPEDLADIKPAAGPDMQAALPIHRIKIQASDNVWVEIRNKDGEALLSRILKPGDSYLVPDEEGLVFDTGNVGALDFVVDGQAMDKLGEVGDVKRGMDLNPEALKKASMDKAQNSSIPDNQSFEQD